MAMDNVWFLTVTVVIYTRLIQSCPEKCSCYEYNKMTCENVIFKKKDLKQLIIPSAVSEVRFVENQIEEISTEILETFRNITSLVISKNLITSIPANTFKYFKHLKRLDLNRNRIKTLSTDSFNGLVHLRNLILDRNDILSLRPGIFDKLTSIRSIKLINNNIQFIPNDVFPSLINLRDLFLTNNNLTRIGGRAFQNMSMTRLELSHNKLKRIPSTAFKGFHTSFRVFIFFNPFECLCGDLMDYSINLRQLHNKMYAYCETPYELKDKNILSAYSDTKCSTCDLKPCRNIGVCIGNKTSFVCQCTEQYKGRICDVDICEYTIKYITKVVHVPGKTVTKFIKRDGDNKTDPIMKGKYKDDDTHKKLMILYAMCSLEFIVILCFVALFMWKRYQDWKLLKEYDHQKRKQILEKIRNTTNKKLQKSLY